MALGGIMGLGKWSFRVALLVSLAGLAACGGRARIDPGPDEFSVIPQRQLEDPSGLAALPAPGGVNATAPSGIAAGIVALGGRPVGTPPATPGAGAISQQRSGGFFGRLFGRGTKSGAALDPAAEAARLRALGIAVLG